MIVCLDEYNTIQHTTDTCHQSKSVFTIALCCVVLCSVIIAARLRVLHELVFVPCVQAEECQRETSRMEAIKTSLEEQLVRAEQANACAKEVHFFVMLAMHILHSFIVTGKCVLLDSQAVPF